jgi:hypothetical protein
MSETNEYPLMVDAGAFTYRHLRDEGPIYGFRSGYGFVDKMDVRQFGWTVRRMDDPALPEETHDA